MVSRLVYFCVVVLVALGGCDRKRRPAVGPTHVVTDAHGRQVTLPSTITRIVSLAPSTTEMVFALGAGPKLVGVDQYSDYPAETATIPKVGSNIEPSTERILGARPDVVLTATSANRQTTTEELGRLGIPVVVTRGHTLEQIFADIAIVGDAIDARPAAAALTTRLRADLAAVQQKSQALQQPTSCAIIVWPEPLMVAGPGSHLDDVLAIAGGTNIAADSTQPFPSYSTERLIQRAPAVLIVGTHKQTKPLDLTSLEKLTTVPAVRDHRIHIVDGDALFRPGPRIGEAAATLFRLLHEPERH